jgi:hypothetical protein
MPDNPSTRWYWNDWDNDLGLKLCSFAAQGLWMRMLSLAARSKPAGFISMNGRALSEQELADLVGHPETEVTPLVRELEDHRVFSRDRHRRIYSRRMVKDERNRVVSVQYGKKGGNPALRQPADKPKENSPPLTPPDKPPIPIPPTQPPKEDSEAIASAAKAAPNDPVKDLWDRSLVVLARGGIPERQARSITGKWRKEYGDVVVLDAIIRAESEFPSEPVAFLTGCMRSHVGSINGHKLSPGEKLALGFAAAPDAYEARQRARAAASEPLLDTGRPSGDAAGTGSGLDRGSGGISGRMH